MEKKLFGTDGIRGKANKYPLDVETITTIGMATRSVTRLPQAMLHLPTSGTALWARVTTAQATSASHSPKVCSSK